MLPVSSGGHTAYQDFFVANFLDFYPDPFVLSRDTWDTIIEFWFLDLSATDTLMRDSYSKYGPEPRLPSDMLRSYLLSIKLKITSITQWVSKLKECPLYALLSGFPVNDVPGIGTFYDFFSRPWQSDRNNLSPYERFPNPKLLRVRSRATRLLQILRLFPLDCFPFWSNIP